jgi:hypothetical protein
VGKLLSEVFERALKRPWLLAAPLLGMLGQNVASLMPPSLFVRVVVAAVFTAAATTLFAELWLGDGARFEPERFVETGKLYLLPYPLLLVFGALTTPLVYWVLHTDMPRTTAMGLLYLVLAAGKLLALALGAVSSLAAARRREAAGTWAALKLGLATVLSSAGFLVPAMIGVWLFQEACVFLAGQLSPGLLGGFVTTAVPLLGCVALPIEAWRSGRLKTA